MEVRCVSCGEDYELPPAGSILLHICPACQAKPTKPFAYIVKNGFWIPNPELDKWST